jgi:hypothetical protein
MGDGTKSDLHKSNGHEIVNMTPVPSIPHPLHMESN